MKMENTQKNREKPQRIAFEPTVFRGYLIRGDLNSSISYVAQFPEKQDLYHRYQELFEQEHYLVYGIPDELNQILLAYQKYISGKSSIVADLSPTQNKDFLQT